MTSLKKSPRNQNTFKSWWTVWLAATISPCFSTWAYGVYISHDGLYDHSDTPIYVMLGVFIVVAIVALWLSSLRVMAKIVLSLLTIVIQCLVMGLGMILTIIVTGLGP